MHAVTNSLPAAITETRDFYKFDSTKTVRSLRDAEYADRQDQQHRHLWDQERARMTFADTATEEETALTNLFEYVRQSNLNPIVEPPPASSVLPQPGQARFAPSNFFEFSPPPPSSVPEPFPQRDPYAPVEEETCMHISSYDELMRSTSYRLLQSHAGSFSEIPISTSRRFEVSLNTVVNSADFAASRGRSESLRPPTLRCEAYLSMNSRSAAALSHGDFKRARGQIASNCSRQLDRHYLGEDMRQALFGLWDRVVARKNASLMLEVVRRKLKPRYRNGPRSL